MPLYTTLQLLEKAEEKEYAVPAFNAYNVESAIAIINTAERLASPVIIQAYDRLFNSDDALCVAACVKSLATKSSVPVALHLDHGSCERSVVRAIRYGYTGIMIDGSAYGYGKNIEITSDIVKLCNHINIPVEGELGHVGKADSAVDSSSYTDPDAAKNYAQQTGIDMLAVMVGSAHGLYKHEPKLDIERIHEIKEKTQIPLVLHGGSGIPDMQIKQAIAAGIRKINVATSICIAYYEGFKHLKPEDDMYKEPLDVFMKDAKGKVESFIENRITLFGSGSRA
jgi:ketose-bisphosphate aldolase